MSGRNSRKECQRHHTVNSLLRRTDYRTRRRVLLGYPKAAVEAEKRLRCLQRAFVCNLRYHGTISQRTPLTPFIFKRPSDVFFACVRVCPHDTFTDKNRLPLRDRPGPSALDEQQGSRTTNAFRISSSTLVNCWRYMRTVFNCIVE